MSTYYKDPQAVLDYGFNWTIWLDGDTISTSEWDIPTDLTEESSGITDNVKTYIFLSGGTIGEQYPIVNTITTTQGRTEQRSFNIIIQDLVDAGTSFTAYLTIDEAEEYFMTVVNSDAWDQSTEVKKQKSLIEATRLIDQLNFQGEKHSEDQERQFPRGSETVVPNDIKYACAELALRLLDDVDLDSEIENQKLTGASFGPVRSTYDRTRSSEHILAGIPSIKAWRLLLPYLSDIRTIQMNRVS